MKDLKVAISGFGSISPLGMDADRIWERYLDNGHCFRKKNFAGKEEWIAPLTPEAENHVSSLVQNKKYHQLDPTVHYAIAAARLSVARAGWKDNEDVGINIGSSRGATSLFERYHRGFLENGQQQTNPLTSPSTTLGNIASWVAGDLNTKGPVISHSSTCSTALQAIINGIAWLRSGMSTRFLAGGSEAPLTAFTIAQMKAMKIYSQLEENYPVRSMDLSKTQNSMILGEGAACFCLELNSDSAEAYITGIGYGTELINHGASLSRDAKCLQYSMKMALDGHDPGTVDAIIMHSPGTILGDSSEIKAIDAVFGTSRPVLTGNKWKIGHTLGASGALSLEMALLMLRHNQLIRIPYLDQKAQEKPLRKILINAAGFGGTAMSVIVEKNG